MTKVYLAFLDDGHGIETPGKRSDVIPELGRQVKENEFNSAVVDLLAEELKRHGVQVFLTAPGNNDVPLKTRTDYANKIFAEYKAKYGAANVVAVFLSIHYNASDGKFGPGADPEGFSVHIYKGQTNKGAGNLARCLQKYLAHGTSQKNRGIVEQDLHVTRETAMVAALTENGFMDNLREARLMLDKAFQKEVAVEHAQGTLEYMGLKWTEAPAPTPAPKPAAPTASTGSIYRVFVGGSKVGAFSDCKNILALVEDAVKKGIKDIKIEKA